MRKSWWKILCVAILVYTVIAGLLLPVPEMFILNETIRNTYFHVPMWFGMIILFSISLVFSIRYLNKGRLQDDIFSVQFVNIGILFGVLGLVTGMEWAKFTWGEAWSNDPKQLSSALCMLIYFSYTVLRGAIPDDDKKARIASVYNIFAFALTIPLLFILPRLTDSLHPGNGGNPGFNTSDMSPLMRPVFYPSIIGWTLLGVWIATLAIRIRLIEKKEYLHNDNSFEKFDFEK